MGGGGGGGGAGDGEQMKQRVNRCLNKLSDRDTEAMGANELESIARSLTPDALPPFLSAISETRPTDKTPLRRQSLRIISLISNSHPAAAIAPHLPRMLSAALRRLRDPDSSVRAACVDAVRSIAAAAPAGAVAGVLLRPLIDALLHEQDQNAQISAALCLAAAVDAAGANPDLAHHLQKLLPRLVKLVRSNAFKAKAALISLLGSVAAAGGATAPALVGVLVPCLVEFLASEDWAARKAAAEALAVVAVSEKDLLVGFKSSCISSFESRRFDKVKIVRDSMNRMLDVWKEIPSSVDSESYATPVPKKSQPNSSPQENGSDGQHATASLSSSSVRSTSPFIAKKSRFSSRSPPPDASPIITARKTAPSIRNKKLSPPLSRKADQAKASDWKVEISVANTPAKVVNESKLQIEQGGLKSNVRSRLEARRMLFEKNCEEKGSMLVGLKSGARVVPCQENEILESTAEEDDISNELNAGHKDGDLLLIRMQLVQIENQQSSLLDLLQRFIGNSQNDIHSLETQVHGLEMALDEISHNIAVPSGRMLNNDPEVNTCCRLPGTEFLSGKFRRRHEGRYSSMFSISDIQNPDEGRAAYKWDKQRFGLQGGVVVNPLAEINPQSRATAEIALQRMMKSGSHDTGNIHAHDGRKQDLVPQMIRTA